MRVVLTDSSVNPQQRPAGIDAIVRRNMAVYKSSLPRQRSCRDVTKVLIFFGYAVQRG